MKKLFLSILAIVLTVGLIRIIYGLQANTLQYSIDTFLNALPDVKSDFQIVNDSASDFVDDLRGSFSSIPALEDPSILDYVKFIWEYVKAFFSSCASVFKVVVAFLQFLGSLLFDLVELIAVVFELLFLPASDPIVNPLNQEEGLLNLLLV